MFPETREKWGFSRKNNASFITSKIRFSKTPYNEAFNEVFF